MDVARLIREQMKKAIADGRAPTTMAIATNVNGTSHETAVTSDGDVTVVTRDGETEVIRHDGGTGGQR